MNHEETENLIRLTTNEEIKSVVKILPRKNSLKSVSFNGNFYQTLAEELTSILKLLQKCEEEE
jgi:Ran GTPase-activating protein (RanGAP) involved in mRNA processing and transport